MKLLKPLLKHPRTQAALSWLLSMYIRLAYFTSRIDRHVDPLAQRFMKGEDNAVFAFWHGRMMLLPAFQPPNRKMHVLISLHRDGKLISDVIGHFGQTTISGSTSRGGKEAVLEMLRKLKEGDNISITPDGPRGPMQIAAQGTATVAKLSGRPVLPVTFAATRCKRFSSWDRFMLALPFGRIVFCVGAPLSIDTQSDEEGRLLIENAMNALVEKADGLAYA